MTERDAFARSSAARAWQAAREANQQIEELLARLDRIERRSERQHHLQRCGYCGTWSLGPACRDHFDLMNTADLLEEALGA